MVIKLSRSECWVRMRLWDLGPCHGSKALLDSAVHELELDAVEARALVAPRMDFDLIADSIDQKKPRKQVRTAAIRISRREAAHKSTLRLFPLKLQYLVSSNWFCWCCFNSRKLIHLSFGLFSGGFYPDPAHQGSRGDEIARITLPIFLPHLYVTLCVCVEHYPRKSWCHGSPQLARDR